MRSSSLNAITFELHPLRVCYDNSTYCLWLRNYNKILKIFVMFILTLTYQQWRVKITRSSLILIGKAFRVVVKCKIPKTASLIVNSDDIERILTAI